MIRHRPHTAELTLLLCCAASTLTGCPGTDAASTPVVTDSAGVRIISSPAPSWQDSVRWSVQPEPSLEIGVEEGDLAYQFDRLAGAIRLPDGSIVVADGGTNEVRFFSEEAVHLRSVGRTGSGPGEYEYIRALRSCGGDSIFAFDLSWQLKVYSLAGQLARETTLLQPGTSRTPYNLSCSSSTGAFVITGWGAQTLQRPIGFHQSTSPVYVLDAEGDLVLELGEFLSSERIGTETGSRPHPFGRAASFAITEDEVFVGTGEEMQVLVYGLNGSLQRVFRGPAQDLSIRAEHLDAYREQSLRDVPDDRRPELERQLRSMPMPAGFPAFTALLVDPTGHIWVKLFQRPGTDESRWGVFAADGAYHGDLLMPRDLDVTVIGPDYVLGVHRDDLGVERVRLHALDRAVR